MAKLTIIAAIAFFLTGSSLLGRDTPIDEPVAVIPFEVAASHIYVRARVNDSQLLWLIVDTGAASTLWRGVGNPIVTSNSVEHGIGGDVPIGISPDNRVLIENLALSHVLFVVDGSAIAEAIASHDGHHVDGLLGWELFERYAVEIDYGARTLRLYDSDHYQPRDAGCRADLEMFGKTPGVRGVVVSNAGRLIASRFMLDTGGDMNIVAKPFSDSHPELPRRVKTIQEFNVVELGGDAPNYRVGRLRAVRIAGCVLKNTIVDFSHDTRGLGGTTDLDVVLGGPILSRFTVAFDVRRHIVTFKPNSTFHQPSEYDMSGLHVVAAGKDFQEFRVDLVALNSVGAKSGVLENDVIKRLNGRAASALTLTDVRRALRTRGSARLQLARGSRIFKVTLPLKPRT